jgi:hypothetical protein
LFSEVDVDMKIVQKSKHDTNPTTSRAILASDCVLNLPSPEQRFSSLLPIRFDIAQSGGSQPTELFCQVNKKPGPD